MEINEIQVYTILIVSILTGFLALNLGKELYK